MYKMQVRQPERHDEYNLSQGSAIYHNGITGNKQSREVDRWTGQIKLLWAWNFFEICQGNDMLHIQIFKQYFIDQNRAKGFWVWGPFSPKRKKVCYSEELNRAKTIGCCFASFCFYSAFGFVPGGGDLHVQIECLYFSATPLPAQLSSGGA